MNKANKPKCKLLETDANIFSLVGKASKALKKVGLVDEAKELSQKLFQCGSYNEALRLLDEYVEIV